MNRTRERTAYQAQRLKPRSRVGHCSGPVETIRRDVDAIEIEFPQIAKVCNQGPEIRIMKLERGGRSLFEKEGREVEGHQLRKARDARRYLAIEAGVGEVEVGEIRELLEPRRRETLVEQIVRKVERSQGSEVEEIHTDCTRYEAIAEVESGDPTPRTRVAGNALPVVAAVGVRLPRIELGGGSVGGEAFLQLEEGGPLVREALGHGS